MKRFYALAAAAFLLTSCDMPTGYVYHDALYKKPVPGSSASGARLITQSQAAQIYGAISDLTARLTQRAGLAPRPVFIDTPAPASQLETMMDNDLRDSLRRLGYVLSDNPESGYVIKHRVKAITLEGSADNAEIALDIHDGTQDARPLLTSETGFYYISSLEEIIR